MTRGGRGVSQDLRAGRVLETTGGVYRLRLDSGEDVEASLRGRLKRVARTGNRVVAGERVLVTSEGSGGGCTIEEVLPRDNELVRAGPGGRGARIVAANLDRCVVVLSVDQPPFDLAVADRFLVLAESCGIPPVLVLNKIDLPGWGVDLSVQELYESIGYPVVPTSALTGEGCDEVRTLSSKGASAFVGPSGSGKSSLLNRLDPSLLLRTGTVGVRSGRGRHTTVGSRLLELPSGGWVADTPGFSDVRLWGMAVESLAPAFPEFREPGQECRFRRCSHLHEPGCGVREALDAGRIAGTRYRSYEIMYRDGSG